MKKLARAIVKMRRLILIVAVLLLIPAAVGAIQIPLRPVPPCLLKTAIGGIF